MARPVERGEENVEIGRGEKDGDSTSISIRDLYIPDAVTTSITEKLVDDPPFPALCCIFRVPPLIKRKKVESYTPDIISIGPFHRRRNTFFRPELAHQQFQLMENVKRWYLKSMLKLFPNITLESLTEAITKLNISARQCYSEKFDDIGDVEFIEMMILDGCFLLEFFRNMLRWRKSEKNLEYDKNDPIVNLVYMQQYLYHDLLLLENQLPWFVLERLYDLTVDKEAPPRERDTSLPQLVGHFFDLQVPDESYRLKDGEVFHHILDLIRSVKVKSFNKNAYDEKEELYLQRIPNATTLSEAGVKFKTSEDGNTCILNIAFQNGVFTIPRLKIDETTDPLFRNLIAYEQCHRPREHMITSYAVLMDSLIDTSKDVDLLSEKKILVNWLSSEDASKFFNGLYNDTAVVGFYYKELCKDVNAHYNKTWNKWMEKLRRDYFSTPWAVISFIAALILLVLTVLQTIYAAHSS